MAYFANGTEGEKLDAQCDECPLGKAACPIFLVQMLHNYDQCDNSKLKDAMNLLINEEGICQMRKLVLKAHDEAKFNAAPIIKPMPAMMEWAQKHGLKVAATEHKSECDKAKKVIR